MDLNVTPEISLSLFYVPDVTQWRSMTRNSNALKRDVERDVATSLLFFLVSARFCFDADVGYINISLIVILNAKTTSRKATPTTEVGLYLAYHLTRQTICGFGFS